MYAYVCDYVYAYLYEQLDHIPSSSILMWAYKDKASTLGYTEDNQNMTDFDASITETSSTAQYKSVFACLHYCMYECYIVLASMRAIYYSASLAWDYVSEGNACSHGCQRK